MARCEPGCQCGRHRGRTACAVNCDCRRCYGAKHKVVYRARGKASDHTCVECGDAAVNWAQTHDTDGTDPQAHYQPMCLRCHRRYDGWGVVMSEHKKRYWASVPLEEKQRFSKKMNDAQWSARRRNPSTEESTGV